MPETLLSTRASARPVHQLDSDEEKRRLRLVAAEPAQRRRRRIAVRPTDALLPLALGLWVVGVRGIQPAAMNDYGLLPALPVVFFVGLALLVGSIVVTILKEDLSPVRLGLHLVALVVVLHGTIPLVFSQPNFPWVYKHIGVVGYINIHGALDTSVDIYQNWPGFFSVAAWFTNVAGVGSPMAYAAWAPVYFNLLICLELAFVFRFLPVTQRVRWLALFLFVAGNWVGQDYFAPQALAFVLSLGTFGILLAWFQVDRPPAAVRAIRRLAAKLASNRQAVPAPAPPPSPRVAPFRVAALGALFTTFAAVVVTHQLSPYVMILGVGLLTVSGLVRPRWLVVGMIALAFGYLLLHLSYIQRTQDLFGSLGDPLNNVHGQSDDSVPMRGRQITALAAPALIAGMWALGALGIIRRLRAGRTVLVLALLAGAPGLVALGQSYGGEAVFRIYLFSLPWTAVLAASALDPRPRRWPVWPAAKVGVVLSVALLLFMSAFYGSEELYVVRPGEVAASQYFYEHAEPGSVLSFVAPNFPIRVSGRYDEFHSVGDNLPNLLTTVKQFRHRMLGPDDLPAISTFVDDWVTSSVGGRFLALSTGQEVYARVLGLLPPGSVEALDRALAQSPNWSVFYRNSDAVIYRSLSAAVPAGGGPGTPPVAPVPPSRSSGEGGRALDWAAIATALLGMGGLGVVWMRRRAAVNDQVRVAFNKEEIMPTTATTDRPEPEDALGEGFDPDQLGATVPTGDINDLLRQALLTPADARQPFDVAISRLQREPGRIRELVGGVDPARRAEAVHLLGEAWGPVSSAHIRPLLDDLSGSVRAAAVAVLDRSPEGVAELRQLLGNDLSSSVRVAATRALADAPEDDQLAALRVALADPEPKVRSTALETLPAAGTARAAKSLLAAIDDPQEQVRHAAYRRLATTTPWILWMAIDRCARLEEICAVLHQESQDNKLVALVQERMSSPEARDRILALELSSRLQTQGWVEESINALQDPEAAIRAAAVKQLHGRPEAAAALVAALQDDPDPAVRAAAAAALDDVEVDNVLLGFVGALQDPEPAVRRTAIEVLVRRRSPGLAQRIAKGLTTANSSSVGEVLLRMEETGEDALVAAAIEGPSDRSSAAAALIRQTGKVNSLVRNLGAVDPTTRLRAVETLGTLGGPEARDGLVAALTDSWPGIRSRAAFYLGRMGDEAGREALERVFESDQAPEVLRAAGEALNMIEERARQAHRPDGE